MSKKKKQTKQVENSSTEAINPKKASSPSSSIMGFYFKSLITGLFIFLGIWYMVVYDYHDVYEAEKIANRIKADDPSVTFEERQGLFATQQYMQSFSYKWFNNYKWLYHNLLRKNLEVQFKNDTFSIDQRYAYKNGADFMYLKILRDQTPEDAVILMPDAKDAMPPADAPPNSPQFAYVLQKSWAMYFLYPRKLVYDEIDGQDSVDGVWNYRKDPDYAKNRAAVTHVAIIYGNGYEHINYPLDPMKPREAHAAIPIKAATSNNN